MSEDKQPRQAPIPSKDWHGNKKEYLIKSLCM